MRLPALIIASAGNGYQILYKSKAFDGINPKDLHNVCERMDAFKYDGSEAYIVTQLIGKIVVGKSTLISKPEYGERKIKVTHCYFMNMTSFVDIIRGYRKQNAVIGTFCTQMRQDYDDEVENIKFVRKPSAENSMSSEDIANAILAMSILDDSHKVMISDFEPMDIMKVLFGYFPAAFISDISMLTSGESKYNDINLLFGNINVLSSNKVVSVSATAKGMSHLVADISSFVLSDYKNNIVDIMEYVDRVEEGYILELIDVVNIITSFEKSEVISSAQIIKLMDKASTLEAKMAIYGIILEIKNHIKNAQIAKPELLEKYWAFALFTTVVNKDKGNAALIHNICTRQRGMDRESYLNFIKEAVILKHATMEDENIALLVLLAHEKSIDKTRLLNSRYNIRTAKAFISNRLSLGNRMKDIEDIMTEMYFN